MSKERWQLVLAACQELYFSPDMKSRRESQSQTQVKILKILSKSYGSAQAAIVLEMILLHYQIQYEGKIWEQTKNINVANFETEISDILIAVYETTNVDAVYQRYLKLLRKVQAIESLGS